MIMRKLAIFVLVSLLGGAITGCTSTASHEHANLVAPSAPANLNETVVADTMKQLITLYPPASTRFDLAQPTTDAYGFKLVQSLRLSGYALSEFVPAAAADGTNANDTDSASSGLSLRYILDAPDGLNLYRVTVMIGSQSLSRAYLVRNNTVSPAGAWARKE
jgi:type IV secretion system protein TrbH